MQSALLLFQNCLVIVLIFQISSMAALKVAIVTGSNKGIGLEIARGLVKHGGYRVLLACRNVELGKSAASELGAEFCGPLDIASQESIDAFPSVLKSMAVESVDVLVNNAGFAFKGSDPTPHSEQAEPTLKGNTFGTIMLTKKLLPLMNRDRDGGADKPRIVNVSSFAGGLKILKDTTRRAQLEAFIAQGDEEGLIRWAREYVEDTKNGHHAEKGWPGTNYGMSKLVLTAHTKLLPQREEAQGIIINALCPGWCATDMSSHGGPRSAAKGAETAIYLATSAEVIESAGFYQDLALMEW
jgi:NAD(P)-dependent dehydrogenase (short-subunit alcohol dehydrogenase family)